MIRKHCEALEKEIASVVDLYLHGYDLEETCVAVKQCEPTKLALMPPMEDEPQK